MECFTDDCPASSGFTNGDIHENVSSRADERQWLFSFASKVGILRLVVPLVAGRIRSRSSWQWSDGGRLALFQWEINDQMAKNCVVIPCR